MTGERGQGTQTPRGGVRGIPGGVLVCKGGTGLS